MNQPLNKSTLLATLLFLSAFQSFAQPTFLSGARQASLANAIITIENTFSVFYNPAEMADVKRPSIGIAYNNHFLIKELSTRSMTAILPYSKGSFGSAFSYFGTPSYNEQKIALGYARRLNNKVKGGILLDLYSIHLPENFKTTHALAGEIGLSVNPVSQLDIGVHITNISNSIYNEYIQQSPGMQFRSGISWTDKHYLVGTQLTMISNQKAIWSVGTEISLANNFDFRLGASNHDTYSFTFGVGYTFSKGCADIAFARHPVLGYSSFISTEFIFGNVK
jgi:hypothetical protein